jgi:membrane protein CcdC involved in cytochrome C biogenesis
MPDEGLPLERWANFYLITTTAAATLIGLLFILITLAADKRPKEVGKIGLYLTPTVVYFISVLLLAAVMTFPNQSRFTAMLCICSAGALGLLYSVSMVVRKEKFLHRWDVFTYVVCPLVAYGLLVRGGLILEHTAQRGLTLVAVAMLALITLGVRNSWGIAVDVVSPPREHSHSRATPP